MKSLCLLFVVLASTLNGHQTIHDWLSYNQNLEAWFQLSIASQNLAYARQRVSESEVKEPFRHQKEKNEVKKRIEQLVTLGELEELQTKLTVDELKELRVDEEFRSLWSVSTRRLGSYISQDLFDMGPTKTMQKDENIEMAFCIPNHQMIKLKLILKRIRQNHSN